MASIYSLTFSLLRVQVSDVTVQPRGVLHGGVSGLVIEGAASEGAHLNIDTAKFFPAGIELNASHLRAAHNGSTIVATAVRTQGQCGPAASSPHRPGRPLN